jgi:ribonuclease HI
MKKNKARLNSVKIHIDGSCKGQGTSAAEMGIGVVVTGFAHKTITKKLDTDTTQDSNRAEVYALAEALKWLKDYPGLAATIYSDSSALVRVVHGLQELEDENGEDKSFWRMTKDIWEKEVRPLIKEVRPRIKNVIWTERENNGNADKVASRASRAFILVEDHDLPQFA